jgi:hypothetical protein
VRRPGAAARFDVVVGASGGGPAGVLLSGGARIHGCADDGLEVFPRVVIGGETARTGSLLGELVNGGTLGGVPFVLVGGSLGSGSGLDEGAAYTAPLLP